MSKLLNELAEDFASLRHAGQVYGDGSPYIEHLARVAGFFDGYTTLGAIAWLHDVVEDTDTSLETVRRMFGLTVTNAVDAISRREETYSAYLDRVEDNSQAKQVKLVDLADNLSNCFNAKGKVKEEHIVKQRRYVKAIKRLLR